MSNEFSPGRRWNCFRRTLPRGTNHGLRRASSARTRPGALRAAASPLRAPCQDPTSVLLRGIPCSGQAAAQPHSLAPAVGTPAAPHSGQPGAEPASTWNTALSTPVACTGFCSSFLISMRLRLSSWARTARMPAQLHRHLSTAAPARTWNPAPSIPTACPTSTDPRHGPASEALARPRPAVALLRPRPWLFLLSH